MINYNLYMAGPLFTLGERQFNKELKLELGILGYKVWLPQEHEPRELTAKTIFEADKEGLDWCDIVVACMDQADPDSGTAWECGYAYGKNKPVILYRTDLRAGGEFGSVNLMLSQSCNLEIKTNLTFKVRDYANKIDEALKNLK